MIASSAGPSGPLAQTLERAIEEVDPRVPILSTVTVEQHVSGSLWLFRLGAVFTAALGLLALGLGVALKSLLFGVQPGDPAILLGVAAALVAVSLLAVFFPALSASRTDPARTLRNV